MTAQAQAKFPVNRHGVLYETQPGHISVHDDHDHRLILAAVNPTTIEAWTFGTTAMGPDTARSLAAALTMWADRADGQVAS